MGKSDKELAVELAIEIIKDLKHERMIDCDGRPVNIEITKLLNNCYKAITQLGGES